MENGNVYSINIRGWKSKISCIKIKEGKDWILIQNLNDYMIDGLSLINKKYVKDTLRNENELLVEDVLKANDKIHSDIIVAMPLETPSLFDYLYQMRIIFQLGLKDDSYSYVGQIQKITNKSFYLKRMNAKGLWINDPIILRKDFIRTIELNTDYLISLSRYNKSLTLLLE